MIYIKKYTINQTSLFENELEDIYRYLTFKLNEPNTAKKFYNKVIEEIYSLQYFPERYARIADFKDKNRNLRRLLIGNYVVIYEINSDTRTNIYFTYFSFKSKLFKFIIKQLFKSNFINFSILFKN